MHCRMREQSNGGGQADDDRFGQLLESPDDRDSDQGDQSSDDVNDRSPGKNARMVVNHAGV